jgi:murein DD-endopeptidase MepM/ murein hydrolase activator NlpD
MIGYVVRSGLSGIALVLAACGTSDAPEREQTSLDQPPMRADATPEQPASESTLAILSRFTMPLAGACLPSDDNLMPNADREYRSGTHEGIDFYWWDNCVDILQGSPVLAVKRGVVTRADTDYSDLTADEMQELLDRTYEQGYTDRDALDQFGGRQVWIDHGGGVVTTYNHLGAIAPAVTAGTKVEAGEIIGYVGDSGTPQSVRAPGTEMHLHFEVWVNKKYLGEDLTAEQVRAMYEHLFGVDSVAQHRD